MEKISDYTSKVLKTINGSLVFIGEDDQYDNLKVFILDELDHHAVIHVVDGLCKIPDSYDIWGRWDRHLKIVGDYTYNCKGNVFKIYTTIYNDIVLQIF